jgi:type II secretory pathway pseudopilin PulG
MDLGIIGALAGVAIAMWQLFLQQRAIANNARITTLVQLIQLLDRRLDENQRLIDAFKESGQPWTRLRDKNQNVIKPLRANLQELLVDEVRDHAKEIEYNDLNHALNLSKE